MENSQRVWIMYIVFSLKFLTVKELSTERHFIIWAAKLNQNGYKGIMTSKFGSKVMMLWKSLRLFSQKMKPHGLLLSQYGMTDHTLLKGCYEHPQKIISHRIHHKRHD